jgi:hypothetical protein
MNVRPESDARPLAFVPFLSRGSSSLCYPEGVRVSVTALTVESGVVTLCAVFGHSCGGD